ncbi:MAG TPA: tetratricopeptide repeat protein [Terriglobales bacterium]|nr:tetratricopeptide repeat protein [Terriglobales bacterium]
MRYSLYLLILALVVGESPAFAQQSGKTVRKHRQEVEDPVFTPALRQAEAAMDRKDYPAAEKDLLTVVDKNPQNYRAWFDLGFIYNETGRTPQAIEAYRKSTEANPQIFESTLNLGILLARSNSPDAEKYLLAATKLKPSGKAEEGWYRAWLSLGEVLRDKKPTEAIEAFQNAGKLKPTDAEPHLSAGLLLEQQQRFADAALEYRRASELDPNSTEAWAGMVNAYSKLGQFAEAEQPLRKYISLNPNNATAHVQLGRLLLAQKKSDEAAAEFEKGLQAKPGDLEAQKEIIGIYIGQKLYKNAEPHLASALRANPNDPQLHHWYGLAMLGQKRPAEAQAALLNAAKLNPRSGEIYADLAIAASENKNYPLIIQALDARAKFLPELPATYYLRATAYDHLRAPKEAIANYKQFLAAADGKFPNEEWKARQRILAIEPKK